MTCLFPFSQKDRRWKIGELVCVCARMDKWQLKRMAESPRWSEVEVDLRRSYQQLLDQYSGLIFFSFRLVKSSSELSRGWSSWWWEGY